jgi:hypothetical protein
MHTLSHNQALKKCTKVGRALMIHGAIAMALALVACAASAPVFAQSRPATSTTTGTPPSPPDINSLDNMLAECKNNCLLTKSREEVGCDRTAARCLTNIQYAPAIWWYFMRQICMSDHDICMAQASAKGSNCQIGCSRAYVQTLKNLTPNISSAP